MRAIVSASWSLPRKSPPISVPTCSARSVTTRPRLAAAARQSITLMAASMAQKSTPAGQGGGAPFEERWDGLGTWPGRAVDAATSLKVADVVDTRGRYRLITRGDADDCRGPPDRRRRAGRDRRNRRRLCDVHRRGGEPKAPVGGELERALVPALVLRRDQLHRELGLRGLCRRRLVDRRLHQPHLPAPQAGRRRPGRRLAGVVRQACGLATNGHCVLSALV